MTITPEQADRWAQTATAGPWYVHTDPDGTLIHDDTGNMCIAVERAGSDYLEADLHLAAAAPELAQTIAGMTEEWGVERDRPGTAYIDGTVARWINWVGDEARARKACVISPRGGNPRLVRRLVGPVEMTE
ncbi:hypothetical protein [Corynebacterium variabile]|uniref:hypothetical protein n=1 Tax=Corynebacterium variabile TaxID=1727 RepID=UPI002FDF77A4